MLKVSDFTYELPQEKIALFPLPERDQAKLLVYKKGEIIHSDFIQLADFLPGNAFLFFNDTRVISARMHFQKDTGAVIEIFLLSPFTPSTLLVQAMRATEVCTWECTIGNLKRWHEGTTLTKNIGDIVLQATLIDRAKGVVQFRWAGERSFAAIISQAGETPLPPYLKREADKRDQERYQTIYSRYDGAVAAPTAGLHFTNRVINDLKEKNIRHDFLTLHVSAGTFQPLKSDLVNEHTMHHEQIVIHRKNLENILMPDRFIVAVGTTSMRTLESIYWFGVRLKKNANAEFAITQDDPYVERSDVPALDAIGAVKKYLDETNQETISGNTAIFIKPGYRFRICNALITNFHLPESTLILLIAALIGSDWKKVYAEALRNDYRFLSYGDSSLLIP